MFCQSQAIVLTCLSNEQGFHPVWLLSVAINFSYYLFNQEGRRKGEDVASSPEEADGGMGGIGVIVDDDVA